MPPTQSWRAFSDRLLSALHVELNALSQQEGQRTSATFNPTTKRVTIIGAAGLSRSQIQLCIERVNQRIMPSQEGGCMLMPTDTEESALIAQFSLASIQRSHCDPIRHGGRSVSKRPLEPILEMPRPEEKRLRRTFAVHIPATQAPQVASPPPMPCDLMVALAATTTGPGKQDGQLVAKAEVNAAATMR